MAKYEVDFRSVSSVTLTVEAESMKEALEQAVIDVAGVGVEKRWAPISVSLEDGSDSDEVIARCEGCGTFILGEDEYATDPEDNIYVCVKCNSPAKEGVARHGW